MLSRIWKMLLSLGLSLACDSQSHPAELFVSATALAPGNGSECAPFASLDTAVATALEAGGGSIDVLGNHTDLFELSGAAIPAPIAIKGKGSSIVLTGRLDIEATGYLLIERLSIEAGSEITIGFQVRGQLIVANSTITGFDEAVDVLGGEVLMESITFMHCRNVITVSASQAFLNVSRSIFKDNRGSLILLDDQNAKSEVELLILGSVFDSNSGAGLIFSQLHSPLSASSIKICDSRLLNNSAHIFDFYGFHTKASIRNCIFFNNRNGAIHIEATQANITFIDCEWSTHYGNAIEVPLLAGQLTLINTTFREHISDTPISIVNTGDDEMCLLLLLNVTYIDSNCTTTNRGAGFLLLTGCAASVTEVTIRNVTVAGIFGLFNGLIDIEQGYAEVRQLSILHSRSNQTLLYIVYSSVLILDSQLADVGCGIDALVFLIKNDICFKNLSISNPMGLDVSGSHTLSAGGLIIFVCLFNDLRFVGVSVDAAKGSVVFGQNFGNFTAESFSIRNARLQFGLITTANVNIHLSGLLIENCTAESALNAGRNISVYASNITVVSSRIPRVFGCSTQALCHIANVVIVQSSCSALARVIGATIDIAGLQAVSSVIPVLLKGFSGARVQLTNADVRDCELALVELYNSHATIAKSLFQRIRSEKTLLFGTRSNATLETVSIRDATSETSPLADLQDSSYLQVIDSDVKSVNWTTGITLTDSAMAVSGSSFSDFPFTLITGKSASILLRNSLFHSGGPAGNIAILHGGLLSCDKCESVNVTGTSVTSMHSAQGGGLYLSNSAVIVARSTFRNCSALNGGALALFDTLFRISDSNFSQCSASGSGGAIDVSSSAAHSDISHCKFSLNSAKSGGAVNMKEVLPMLRDVSFSWNNAEYGPDVASYTVSARIASTFSTNESYVSGNPLPHNLIIELLDHFNQVVLTDNSAQFAFHLSPSLAYGGKTTVVAQSGIIDLGTAPFYTRPNSTAAISSSILAHSSAFNFSWKLSFRPCQLGEVAHEDRCERCPTSLYSLSLNDTQCSLCPVGGFCPGGFEIDLDKGYWRTSPNSSELLSCPFPEKCLGGLHSECEEGYTGKLCSECSEGWFRVGTLYCQKCSAVSTAFQLIAFIVQYIGVLSIAFYVSEIKPHEVRSAVLQIWLDHCQCSIVLLRLNTELPLVIFNLHRTLLYFGSLSVSMLPLSCVSEIDTLPYVKFGIAISSPVIVLLCVLTVRLWGIVKLTGVKLLRLSVMLLYFVGPSVIESFTALIIGSKVDDALSLFEDASVRLWSPAHLLILRNIYTPLCCVYIILPLLCLIVAAVCKKLRPLCSECCPFIVSGLKPPLYFSQFVIYYWKLLFIVVAMVVTGRSQLLQVTLALTLLISILPLLAAFEVYKTEKLLLLSIGSKLVVYASLSAAGYFTVISPTDRKYGHSFGAVLLLLHLAVFCLCLWAFTKWKEVPAQDSNFQSQCSRSAGVLTPPQNSLAQLQDIEERVD